jgi:predicted TIM-barrel fold metal-dependent hydrolase
MKKRPRPPKRIIDIHNHLWANDDGARLIDLMDECNIELTLVLGGPPVLASPTGLTLDNKTVLRASRKHPGRLVAGAYFDPRRGKKAVAELRHFSGEGVRVAKLFPNLGYFPDDDRLRPFFDAVAECGMAVLSHCGWLSPRPGRAFASYYSHPGRFEKLVRLYPDTIFIMAHMGGFAGFLEAVMLTMRATNAYVDCSPGQGLWVLETAGALAASVPPGKLMWGADSDEHVELIPRYVQALRDLGYGPHLDKIFYSNARGVLEKIGAVRPG